MSRSSSRAVSIRTGSVLVSRMRRQTSIPSRSGSIRSSTTSEGSVDSDDGQRLAAARRHPDHEAVLAEVGGDERGDRLLVLDHEDRLCGVGHQPRPICRFSSCVGIERTALPSTEYVPSAFGLTEEPWSQTLPRPAGEDVDARPAHDHAVEAADGAEAEVAAGVPRSRAGRANGRTCWRRPPPLHLRRALAGRRRRW